ncbi:hypothetical protein TcWFU_006338 [Taenia crassiceps]|uniref:Tudor domain-containing protein n=1 Tax=Taenia crassiceps TaxID=6207 RepID=A0ABR4QL16_9CEST
MDDRRPSAGRTYKEDEYLCERMNELGTCDEGQEPIGLSEEEVEPSLHEWGVGDLCVCRWCVDNKWYFAEILYITEENDCCDIRLLHCDNNQYFVRLDRIHRIDASSWKWVEDEDNISAAQELLLVRDIELPSKVLQTILSEPDTQSEGGLMKRKGRGKRSKWRTGGGPTGSQKFPALSPFWRTMLREFYKSDEDAIEKMLSSLFLSGFQRGYAKAVKNAENGCT